MANLKTIILIGNSNASGQAPLNSIATADWTRITGNATAFASLTNPIDVTIPGIHVLTPKMPFGVIDSRTITAKAATTVDVSGAALAGTDVNKWLYVRSATAGQGQHRKITAVAGNQATVAAWTTEPTVGGTIELWTDSDSVSAATTTTITKSATTPAWSVNAYAGKWAIIIDPASAIVTQARKIASNTVDTITVTTAWSATPTVGHGFRVLTGSNAVNAASDISGTTCAFREARLYYDGANSYCTGFDYPNLIGFPHSAPSTHNALRYFGPLLELTWRLQHDGQQDLFVITVAASSAYVTRKRGGNGLNDFSWFVDDEMSDWHPGSTDMLASTPTYGLYGVLVSKLLPAAQSWVDSNRAGDRIDVMGIFASMGEQDAQELARAEVFQTAVKSLRDSARQAVADGAYSSIAASRIPFVMGLVRTTAAMWTYDDTVNAAMTALDADDLYTGVVNTDSFTASGDSIHYDAVGALDFGQALYEKYLEVSQAEADASLPSPDRHTLSSLRSKVRRRYERNTVTNDAQSSMVDVFINDSLREIYNTLGDNAWFLRLIETITVNQSPTETTLPEHMRRLYRLERAECPGQQVAWSMVGYTSQGKLKIRATQSGTMSAHYRWTPKELTADSDVALVPGEHVELVVMLACKRLAESTGNQTLSAYYVGESASLWRSLKRDALRHDRQRHEQLTPIDAYDTWTSGSWPSWPLRS